MKNMILSQNEDYLYIYFPPKDTGEVEDGYEIIMNSATVLKINKKNQKMEWLTVNSPEVFEELDKAKIIKNN